MMQLLKVLCVLKSGGDFDARYVDKLELGVRRHLKVPHDFICLTDVAEEVSCRTIKLTDGLKGWWSKVELFKVPGPVIYFELDTIILVNITKLAEAVALKGVKKFFMLKPFRPANKRWGSGVMAWAGDFSYIHERYDESLLHHIERFGDQRFISNVLTKEEFDIEYVQDVLPGVYSYKRHCLKGIPKDISTLCFHGQPRPIDVKHIWDMM